MIAELVFAMISPELQSCEKNDTELLQQPAAVQCEMNNTQLHGSLSITYCSIIYRY